LIDGDLRNPNLHHLFGLAPRPGFGDLLSGSADLSAATRPGPTEGLSVIPCGRCGSRAIDWRRLPELFRRLREEYQIILIDSPPLLPVPDTIYLAQHADGAVLAVRRDVSRLPAVWAALERLNMFRCRLFGAVV